MNSEARGVIGALLFALGVLICALPILIELSPRGRGEWFLEWWIVGVTAILIGRAMVRRSS